MYHAYPILIVALTAAWPVAALALPPADLSRLGFSGAQAQRIAQAQRAAQAYRATPSLSAAGAGRRPGTSLVPPGDYRSNRGQPSLGRVDRPRPSQSGYRQFDPRVGQRSFRPDHHHHHDYVYRPSYPHLHYHWRPTYWSGYYRPSFGGYYSSYSGGVISVGGVTIRYSNPFYVRPTRVLVPALDYSVPIRVPASDVRETAADMVRSEQAVRLFDEARTQFRRGDLVGASDGIERALALLPGDPAMHQFRALVLFARGRYGEASAAIHSVLAVAPGWDRETIERLYDAPHRYEADLNELARYVNSQPSDSAAQFLLAYHYLAIGDLPTAARLLQWVQERNPTDRVTQNLLDAIRLRAGG